MIQNRRKETAQVSCCRNVSVGDMLNKKDAGVSEVVGVLLILTATIILAGVVALFVSNVSDMPEKPLTADIRANDIRYLGSAAYVIMELESGDSFNLDNIKIRLSLREKEGDSGTILTISPYSDSAGTAEWLKCYDTSTRVVSLGDRFKIVGEKTANGIKIAGVTFDYNDHLVYMVYDSNGDPVSSGDILIPNP